MRGSGRTARRAPRAAARTTALAAVLAASGLAAGAASASGTQSTAAPGASLSYQCRFPSGSRPVEVTVSAGLVPRVKKAVQTLDSKECVQLVEDVRGISSATDILERCEAVARRHYPELLG